MKKSISIPDELAEQIEILRTIQGRSFSNCVVFAVRSEIKKQAGKYPELAATSKSGAGNRKSGDI